MRFEIIILVTLVAGCVSGGHIKDPTTIVNPSGKVVLPGCVAPPKKRPASNVSGKYWLAVREIDAVIAPEPDSVTGTALSPDYLEGWKRLEPLLDDCGWCSSSEWVQLYQRAAVIHYYLERKSAAVDYFKKVLEFSPALSEALETQILYEIGKMLVEQNNHAEALAYFEKWEAMCPSSVPTEYPALRSKAELGGSSE